MIATGNIPEALSGGLGATTAPSGLTAAMPKAKTSQRPRKRHTWQQSAYHNPKQPQAFHSPSMANAYPAPYPQAPVSQVS